MYFKEELIGLLLGLSEEEPTIKEIVQVDAYPKIIALKIIETPKGKAYAGNCWTGYEIIADINIEIRIIYTLVGMGDMKWVKKYKHPISLGVVVPYTSGEKTIHELYRMNTINPIACVEDVGSYLLDDRTLQCSILLLLEIKLYGEMKNG